MAFLYLLYHFSFPYIQNPYQCSQNSGPTMSAGDGRPAVSGHRTTLFFMFSFHHFQNTHQCGQELQPQYGDVLMPACGVLHGQCRSELVCTSEVEGGTGSRQLSRQLPHQADGVLHFREFMPDPVRTFEVEGGEELEVHPRRPEPVRAFNGGGAVPRHFPHHVGFHQVGRVIQADKSGEILVYNPVPPPF